MVSPLKSLPTTALLGLAVAIGLAGCAGLPDQRLANEALKRGDTATAQANYQQLADLGYVDAKVGIADIQVQTRDPEQLRQAEATYRASLDESTRAKARLGRLLVAKPDSTQAEQLEAETLLKQAFAAGEGHTLIPLAVLYLEHPENFPAIQPQRQIDQWTAAGYPEAGLAQILLYRTQNTYDQHLDDVERICSKLINSLDVCYSELATVYQKRQQKDLQEALLAQLRAQYQRGAVPAMRVDNVARVLADATLGQTDEKTAKDLLESVAPVYPASWVSLAQLMYDFPELGDVDQMMQYLDKGRAADQPRAELLLGRVYYEGKLMTPDAGKALEHLQKATPSQINAYYYIGQIYRRGYLGHVEPQKAVDNLLIAARGGQGNADYALAQLFSGGRGTLPNPVNAYVFSQLAKRQEEPAPQVLELATQLEQQLQPAQRAQADQLIAQELRLRGAMNQENLALHTPEQDGEDSL